MAYIGPLIWICGTALAVIYCRHRAVNWFVALTVLALAMTYPSEWWANDHLRAANCNGNWLKGLSCPEWTTMIDVAVFHQQALFVVILFANSLYQIVLALAMVVAFFRRRSVAG